MTSNILLCAHGTLLVPVVVSAFVSFTSLSNACLFLWVAKIFTKRRLPIPFLLSYAPASIVLKLNSPILKRVQSIKFVSVFT